MKVDEITIFNRDIRASIRSLGAELVRLQDAGGADYLWSGDPAWWSGRSPILFPIVGEVKDGKFEVDGKTFAMARHGFARVSQFEAIVREDSRCAFRLRPNEETRAQYPFEFDLRLDYEAVGRTLAIRASVSNAGPRPMPASFGFHPAFRWPLSEGLSKTTCSIDFDRPEPAPVERPVDGLLSGAPRPSPVVGTHLALADSLFEDGALVFDRLESRRVVYGAPTGPRIALAFEGMPHLGVWSLPGAGFVCIEPWQGHGSPKNFEGELRDKPGILSIAPGATKQFEMRIEIVPGQG
jgi:galactose mutarotase-like enzyme